MLFSGPGGVQMTDYLCATPATALVSCRTQTPTQYTRHDLPAIWDDAATWLRALLHQL